MSRHGKPGTATLLTAASLLVGLALAAGLSACFDETTGPQEFSGEAVLAPGVNVYLAVDNDAAAMGSRITVTGKVAVVDTDVTPTGYLIHVAFDPAKLKPVRAGTLDDGTLRVINLAAASGLIKAAGAAPDGLKSDVLFKVVMQVVAEQDVEGLEVRVHELTVLEQDFADVAREVVSPPRAVVAAK